jgi:hypothetical protein
LVNLKKIGRVGTVKGEDPSIVVTIGRKISGVRASQSIYQVTSSELIPILRQIEIVIFGQGCPPYEDNIYATFDDVAVNLATMTQGELNGKGLTHLTASGTTGTNAGSIKSSVNGEFTAKFTIPADILCGGRVVKVDSPSGLVTADNIFYGLGIVNHITEYKEITGIKYVIPLTLYSPLAESFVVTDEVFLSSVDVWVYRVPTGNQGGLKVAIRGMSDDG